MPENPPPHIGIGQRARVHLISLGCAKNLVDSEHMLGWLQRAGLEPAPDLARADVAVINTCGFIQEAVEEAIDVILEAVETKKRKGLARIVVAGCLVQRYGFKLRREIPEVDAWLGTGEIHRIADMVGEPGEPDQSDFFVSRPTYLADHRAPRVRSTPFYSAYLKVAEGCSHGCSFCMIPRLRGPFRSREPESVVAEARMMAGQGVKEVNLVAQDTTLYGGDLKPATTLVNLLEQLVAVPEIPWIRLLYCHPERVSQDLLDFIETHQAVCSYLDIPIQHVNPDLLTAMGRTPSGQSVRRLFRGIRTTHPDISLRTTVMVGFPGETETMFEELLDFAREIQFDHLGTFVFHPEKGTAAARLPSRPEPQIGEARRQALMELQHEIATNRNQRQVGRVLPVLVEGPSPESDLLLTGRTAAMAPEVDGQVLIKRGEAAAGEMTPVRITEAHAYDLIGEIVG